MQEVRIQEHIGSSICHLNANVSTSAHKLPRERSYFPSQALDNIKRCTPYQILVYTFFRFAVHLSARRCTPFSIYDRSCEHLRPFMRQNICGRVAIYRTLLGLQKVCFFLRTRNTKLFQHGEGFHLSFLFFTNLFTECAVGTWRGH